MKRPTCSRTEEILRGCFALRVYRLRSFLDLVVQDEEPDQKQQRVNETEHHNRSQNLASTYRL